MDESRTRLLTSIGTFCLFIETVSNKKERGKGISEPMPRFGSNMFLKSNEKNMRKALVNRCHVLATTHFRNPTKKNNILPKSISKNRFGVLQTM
jgi:hypothetical protein